MLAIFHGKPLPLQIKTKDCMLLYQLRTSLCVKMCAYACLRYSCLTAEILLTTALTERAQFGN